MLISIKRVIGSDSHFLAQSSCSRTTPIFPNHSADNNNNSNDHDSNKYNIVNEISLSTKQQSQIDSIT